MHKKALHNVNKYKDTLEGLIRNRLKLPITSHCCVLYNFLFVLIIKYEQLDLLAVNRLPFRENPNVGTEL